MNNKKLGVGFLGAGDVSNLHGEAVIANGNAKLIGLWNRTGSKGIERAKQFSCKFYKEPADLVKDPEVDVVFVSLIIALGGIGALMSPWLIGSIFKISNLFTGLLVCVLFIFIEVVLLILLSRIKVKNE